MNRLYVYGTARDDGMGYAVGISLRPQAGRTELLAMFAHAADARMFAYAMGERSGVKVVILPSADWFHDPERHDQVS